MKGEDKFQTISETVVPKLESDDARINTPIAYVSVTEKQDTNVTVPSVHDAYLETEFSEDVDTFPVKGLKEMIKFKSKKVAHQGLGQKLLYGFRIKEAAM